jgi:protein TonB
MTAHPEVLEQPERLRGAFWGSVAFHLSLAAALIGYAWVGPDKKVLWGDEKGGGLGSVMVNPVAAIPLPSRSGPTNPVANDTESAVPAPPPKTKTQPKAKAPEPDAIALKSRNAKKREDRAAAAPPNKFADRNPPRPGQVTTAGGQALTSPLVGMQGGGGVGVGNNSPFGTQFGEYATRLRDQVARNWKTADLDSRIQTAPPVTVIFTIRRDGSVPTASVKVSESSGNRPLDFSAQRAVLDAVPFPPLPAGYSGSEATVEFKFQLRR